MMLAIKAPKPFNFEQTVMMLQRGTADPINRIINQHWLRCFKQDDHVVLIETMNQAQSIQSKVLVGDISPKQHQLLIEDALGLDDPIINNSVADIPYAEKIESVIG